MLWKRGLNMWGAKDQKVAFNKLKAAISQHPVLCMADFSKQFILQTNAGMAVLETILSQESDGCHQLTAYMSCTLSAHKWKASSIYELECLAMFFCTNKFWPYLDHAVFLSEAHNQALPWLLSCSRQLGKISHWVVKTSSLKSEVKHVCGIKNMATAAQVHAPGQAHFSLLQCTSPTFSTCFAWSSCTAEGRAWIISAQWKTVHEEVPKFSLFKEVVHCPSWLDCRWKVVMPADVVPTLSKYYHTSPLGGQLNVFKTISKILKNFIQKSMENICIYDHDCEICGLTNQPRTPD